VALIADADPAEAVGVVEVVARLAIAEELARADQVGELADRLSLALALAVASGADELRASAALSAARAYVAEEDTWVALVSQEDERVRQRLEARADPGLERFAELRVVAASVSILSSLETHLSTSVTASVGRRWTSEPSKIWPVSSGMHKTRSLTSRSRLKRLTACAATYFSQVKVRAPVGRILEAATESAASEARIRTCSGAACRRR